jgi:hypothetical protein
MPIDKLIPRYLNKDDDFLIVKTIEAVDALNIQTSDDEGGNAGVMKNALGNVVIATGASGDALPSGTNTVIGTARCKQTGEIFYFVHNSSNNHSVYRYATSTNTTKLVYRDSVLGFSATGFVKGDCMVKENGDVLLYFTDGVTDPKKINVTRALANTAGVSGYPYKAEGSTAYTDAEKLLSITTIKAPPQVPPVATVSSDTSIATNNITNKLFQFACQYVYEDGELSAISPYSEIATNYMNFVDGYVTDRMKDTFNAISVQYNHSKGDVSKIRILYREGTFNNFSVFKEVSNNRSSTTGSVLFTNATIGSVISDNEMNKLYDAVPQKSRSQVLSGNRLSYGGYTEFYDNTNVSATVVFSYEKSAPRLTSLSTTTTGTTVSASTTTNNVKFTLDLTNFPESSTYDTTVNLSLNIGSEYLGVSSGSAFSVGRVSGVTAVQLGSTELNINKTFVVSGYADKNVLASAIISQLTGVTYSGITTNANSNLVVSPFRYTFAGSFEATLVSPAISSGVITFSIQIGKLYVQSVDIWRGVNPAIGEDPVIWNVSNIWGNYNYEFGKLKLSNISSSFGIANNAYTAFKSGQRHKFGVVYYDGYNRSSAVNEIGEFYNPNEGSRDGNNIGQSSVIARLSSTPPSWAKKWQLVYAPYTSYDFAYRYSVAEAFLPTALSGATTDRKIYLSMRHLEGKNTSYKEAKGAIFNYSYANGDKLRIVSYVNPAGSGSISYPNEYVFDITGYDYIEATGTLVTSGITNYTERGTGWFLSVSDADYANFNTASIAASSDFWDNDTIIEIYRPIISSSSPVYREIGEVYDVVSGLHYGTRNQNVVVTGDMSSSGGVFTAASGYSLYVGDVLTLSQVTTGVAFLWNGKIKSIQSNASGNNVITFSGLPTGVVNADWNFELDNKDAIVKTTKGDCYYRPRQVKLNPILVSPNTDPANVSGIRYVNYFVEDLSVSDFFVSNYIGIGRPNASAPSAVQIDRRSSITYSEPYALDSSILKLSSFNGSQGNFIDLPNRYGAIQYMSDNGDSITVLQDVKSSVIPINRNLVEYSDGNSNVVISNNYLGAQSVYMGDYGTQNPESVQVYDGRTYFVDKRAGKVIRIGADGIEAISEAGVDAYTQDKCFITVSTSGSYKIIGGIDPQHAEYLVTYSNVSGGTNIKDTIAYDTSDRVWNTRYSFIPEAYEYLDNYMYTFSSGSMYRHTDQATRNNFFGVQASSSVKVISALNNSMVKVANALSIEGDSAPSVTISNKNQSTRAIASGEFYLKEGNYYVDIPRSSGTTGSSNYQAIGVVSASSVVGGNLQLVFSNPINGIPFQTSGTAFITCTTSGVTGTTTYTQATIIDNNTLRFVGSGTPISVGVILVNISDASVDGDVMRGPFFAIDAVFGSASPIEIYAINMHFARSNLANELGNE